MPEQDPVAAPRVLLHIGLHKTGTTYLQRLWAANRGRLARQGVYFPGGRDGLSHRNAVRDLLGQRPRGTTDQRITGQWDAVRAAVAASNLPTALLSAEGLSVADARQAATAVSGFPGREAHVLVTCRDVGRALVSSWQEDVKNDRTWTWAEYAAAVRDPSARGRSPARRFWLTQDLPAILALWSEVVPVDRVHLVTVPPPGADPSELARRVAVVVGYDPAALTKPPAWDNSSLGVAGTELVRRLNLTLDHRLDQREHDHVVKGVLVKQLVRQLDDPRYGLPAEDRVWVEEEARRQVAAVAAAGYDIHGDVDDLVPQAGAAHRAPGEVSTEELLEAAVIGLAGVSEGYARSWSRQLGAEQPTVAPAGVRGRTAAALRGLRFRTRRAAASLADRSELVGRLAARRVSRRER